MLRKTLLVNSTRLSSPCQTVQNSLAQSVHDAGITKTALIVAGNFLGTRYERSKLYDPGFTTEFRKGSDQ